MLSSCKSRTLPAVSLSCPQEEFYCELNLMDLYLSHFKSIATSRDTQELLSALPAGITPCGTLGII